MRMFSILLISISSCLWVAQFAYAQEQQSVTIEYLAHASFVIHAPDGKRILIDPYADQVWIGYIFPKDVSADVVLISHPHFDHDGGEYRSGRLPWAGQVPVLRWPGRWELGDDMVILGIKGHHAGEYGLEFGQVNTLWRLEIAGLNIVHWGDNGPLTAELKASLGKVDILMLPADDAYHLLAREQTNQVLDELKPLVVIPMHYYVPELEDEPIDDFGPLDEWLNGRESVMCLPGNSWQVSKETLPEKPEILVLRIADSVYEVNEVAPPSGTACAN